MISLKWRLIMVCIISSSLRMETVLASQELMTQLSTGFLKALKSCQTELSIGDHITQDFYNYWREDYKLLNRDFGCMVICMAAKHDLITEDMKVHHENAHAFVKAHGADDEKAKQLVTMLHECEKQYLNESDLCTRVLEISKCFRTKIHELKWAPSMEDILEDIMTSK